MKGFSGSFCLLIVICECLLPAYAYHSKPQVSSSKNTNFQQVYGSAIFALPTPEEECGLINKPHTRLFLCNEAAIGLWPWVALIGYVDKSGEKSFKCGGALISKRHVLTAAQCITDKLKFVRLGEHDLTIDNETRHEDVDVARGLAHPNFDRVDGHSDIGILYLARDVQFTEFIQPICIPNTPELISKNYTEYYPIVAGWGHSQKGDESSNVLLHLQLPIIDNARCFRRYNSKKLIKSEKQFDSAYLCVHRSGADSCRGDSGGPLFVSELVGGKHHLFLIGITSHVVNYARTDVPAIYTRVQNFVDWINVKVAEQI